MTKSSSPSHHAASHSQSSLARLGLDKIVIRLHNKNECKH